MVQTSSVKMLKRLEELIATRTPDEVIVSLEAMLPSLLDDALSHGPRAVFAGYISKDDLSKESFMFHKGIQLPSTATHYAATLIAFTE